MSSYEPTPRTSSKAIYSLVFGLLSLVCLPIIGAVLGLVLGIWAMMDIGDSRGRLGGKGLAIGGIVTGAFGLILVGPLLVIGLFVGLLRPAVVRVQQAAADVHAMNEMRIVGLAMHEAAGRKGEFPAPAITDESGKPLLSWRVALLPYLEEEPLYRQFRLNEPWDSPHNLALLPLMPNAYKLRKNDKDQPGYTHLRLFVGKNGQDGRVQPLFPGLTKPARIADVGDGISNTILAVEAREAVPWTKPDELVYDPNEPLPPLGQPNSPTFNVILADCSVRKFRNPPRERALRLLIMRNDGNAVNFDDLEQ